MVRNVCFVTLTMLIWGSSGDLYVNSSLTVLGNLTVTGDLTVKGNLTVLPGRLPLLPNSLCHIIGFLEERGKKSCFEKSNSVHIYIHA